MKETILFSALCLLNAVPATANFEEIQARFSQGRTPTAEEATGWFVGRCFYSSYGDPEVPYSGILFGVTNASNQAPGDLKIMVGPPRDYALPAEQFDDPTDVVLSQLQDLIVDPYYDRLGKAEVSDGSLHSPLPSNDRDYQLRALEGNSGGKNQLVSLVVVPSSNSVRAACIHEKKIK